MATSVDRLEDCSGAAPLWRPTCPTVPKNVNEVGIGGKHRCKAGCGFVQIAISLIDNGSRFGRWGCFHAKFSGRTERALGTVS